MAGFRFHKVAALAVLVATGAWMLTGEFSSVGSATPETTEQQPEARAERPPRLVAVVEPPRIVHARTIRVSGRTEADQRAVLASRVAGIVQDLPVSQGDTIEAGDVVMRLDTEGKESAVESARQLLAQRETEFAATERLVNSGNLPRLQLDTSRSALSSARSQLEAAEAELGRMEVRAPFSGVVDRVRTEVGSAVSQGTEIATVLSLDPILAVGEDSQGDLPVPLVGVLESGDEVAGRDGGVVEAFAGLGL